MSDTPSDFEPVEHIPPPPETPPETPPPEPVPEPEPEPVEKAEPEEEAEEDEGDKRIARLAHEAREAKRLARQLRAELDELKGQRPPAPADEELERRVQERAEALQRQQAFNTTCLSIYEAGAKEYGKPVWDAEIKELAEVSGTHIPPTIIEAAYESGEAHKVIHYLAENVEEYERLLNTPIHRMGSKVALIANKLAAPPPPPAKKAVSKAPPPIKPISSSGNSVDLNWDEMPIDEYMRKRNAEELKRRGY